MAEAPVAGRNFVIRFWNAARTHRVLAFYCRHPGCGGWELWSDLAGHDRPSGGPVNLSNFQRGKECRQAREPRGSHPGVGAVRAIPVVGPPISWLLVWIALVGFPLLGESVRPVFAGRWVGDWSRRGGLGRAEFGLASLTDAPGDVPAFAALPSADGRTIFLALLWAAPRKSTVA